ncbi:zinc finger, CCHC-type containing protein [Tanacetum coccineum]
MHPVKSRSEHIDEFHKLVGDLAAIDTTISDEDHVLLLLASLPSSYDNFVETLLYGRDTLKLEDVLATLNSRKLQKMTEAKGDDGEGLYVRGRFGQRDMEQGTDSAWSKSQERSNRLRNEDQVSGSGTDGYDNVDVIMAMSVEELLEWIMDSGGSYNITYKRDYLVNFEEYDGGNILLGDSRECRVRRICKVQVQMRDGSSFVLDNVRYIPELRRNLISLGTLKKEGFTVKMQSGKIKVIKGSLVVLSGTRRANCVYTFDGQAMTRKTLKGRKQLGEYQTGWKIKTGNVLDSCNQRSTRQCTKSGVAKHLGVAGLQHQNGLVKETSVTLLAKVVLYKNTGFNESEEYKKTFIVSGVGTSSVQVLQGVEFEVEPQEDHTFEVEPHGNVDHVAGLQEVQTQDLIYYHLARDREQHSTHELFSYREDSNEAAFAVAEAEKIYAHESLTFNNTVACEVISKWKAGLKDDMDARSDVYVLSNGCKKCSDDSDVYYWEYTPAKGNVLGMEIVRDQSGNTLRVSQSRFYNGKLVQTLLEGHSILSLEGSLSGDCDVEKNDRRTGFVDSDYAMGRSITRYEFMIQGCVGSWKAYVQHMKALSTTEAAYMTLTEAAKEAIWLKGLAIELGFELKIVADIATGALSKVIPSPRHAIPEVVLHCLIMVKLSVDLNEPKDSSKTDKAVQNGHTPKSLTLEIHHGGWFTPTPCRSYISGQVSSVNVVDIDEFCLDYGMHSLNVNADVLEMSKYVKDYKIMLVYVEHGSSIVDTSMFDNSPDVNRNVKKSRKRPIVVESVVDTFNGLDEILGTSSTADDFSFGKFKEVEVEVDTESEEE